MSNKNIKAVFERILLLERSLNHSDSAVIGGLDAFIAKNKFALEASMVSISGSPYRALTHSERIEWVNQTLNYVDGNTEHITDNYLLPAQNPKLKLTDSIQKVPGL